MVKQQIDDGADLVRGEVREERSKVSRMNAREESLGTVVDSAGEESSQNSTGYDRRRHGVARSSEKGGRGRRRVCSGNGAPIHWVPVVARPRWGPRTRGVHSVPQIGLIL